MQTRAMRVVVRGIVQGVGFRYFVVDEARALGLCGYARNLTDGSVEILAVGAEAAVQRLVEKVRAGPRAARVQAVECQPVTPVPRCDAFTIRG